MNFRKNLKNISLFLFFAFCLILVVLYIRSQIPKVSLIHQNSSTSSNPPVITTAKVTRVIDGDTIVIDTSQKVRYIGMNTPELETNDCFATQAAEINKTLVLGKEVKLEKDVSETDKYGRLLRYVYINNEMINDDLVKDGSAKIETVPPDVKYKQEFLNSEKYAQENKLGLWGKCL